MKAGAERFWAKGRAREQPEAGRIGRANSVSRAPAVRDPVRRVVVEYYRVAGFNNNATDAFVAPSLGDGSARILVNLKYENSQILNLIQAMIGAVTPNFRRVTLEATPEGGLRLRFLPQSRLRSRRSPRRRYR